MNQRNSDQANRSELFLSCGGAVRITGNSLPPDILRALLLPQLETPNGAQVRQLSFRALGVV